VNTTAQIGGALGLAVLATLASTRAQHLTSSGRAHDAALLSGYHLAFWIAAGLMAVAVAIAAGLLSRPSSAPDAAGERALDPDEPALVGG
jgi:hypothetical protein